MQDEFRIGDFTIKPRTLMISRNDIDIHVEPKTMDLLVHLARNAGELVGKKDIVSEVWADCFVTEDVLSNTIWKLRHAFHDDPQKPRYIETIYKKGYRLVAPVRFPEHMLSGARPALAVGRKFEQAELQKWFQEVVESGSGLLVCVSGEAGIGKTTFVENYLRLHFNHGCFIGRGKCSEHLAGSSAYLPIIDALDDLTLSSPDSDLARLLKQTAPCWYVQIFPHSEGALALATQTTGATPERMKRELTEFLSRISDRHPVLLFLDDIHWADTSSIDLLTYVFDHCASRSILILTAYRSEVLLATDHPFINLMLRLRAHGICRDLPLGLLECEDIASYIDQSFPGHQFPSELTNFVCARTEGNPLFMVDLLAHFRHRQVIAYDEANACWVLRQSPAQVENTIPDSIRSLIQLKIRQLGEQNQHLLACAAIQGPEFDSAIIAKALAMDQPQVEEDLQGLDKVHGLIRPIGSLSARQANVPFERYRFNHILYCDALLEGLSPGRKASLSRSVAKAIREIHGEGSGVQTSQLAFLFESAGDFSSAAKYFLAAAQRAIQISAYPEAIAAAQRSLSVLEKLADSPERANLELPIRLALGLSLTQLKGYACADVRESYDRAYAISVQTGNSIQASRCLLAIAAYWLACSNLKETIKVCQRYHRLPGSCRNDILETWFYLISSSAISHWGELAQALDYGRSCVAFGDSQQPHAMLSFGDFDPGSIGRFQLARVLCLCGYPDQARSGAEQALAAARKLEHPYTSAFALFMAGFFYQYLNEYTQSLELSEEAIQISGKYGFLVQKGWAQAVHGWALTKLGKPEEGLMDLEGGIKLLDEIGWRFGRTEILGWHGQAFNQSGNRKGAAAALDRAFELLKETGETYYEPELHRMRAAILQGGPASENGAKVEASLRRAIAVARKQEAKWFELRAATDLARHYADQGRTDDAYKLLHPLHAWFTEGLETLDLQRATQLLDRLKA
jgi:DNA-binding winged helix-turn-helix (wHTH) protein/tetratricopeptide (TPR) repeat protein